MFTFKCPYCKTDIGGGDDCVGESLNCPSCSELLIIPDMPMEADSQFGGCVIQHVICSNPLWTTYCAKGVTNFPDKTVLLRVPSTFIQNQEQEYNNFNETVSQTGKVTTKGFPELIETSVEGRPPCYVYDSRSGIKALREFNTNARSINPYQTLRIIRKLASSLMHLWDEHKKVAQSLTPENICFHSNGTYDILDVGHSQFVFANPNLMSSGLSIWDLAYTAPELIEGRTENTPSPDIFSLGCIFIFLITGSAPRVEGSKSIAVNYPDIPSVVSGLIDKMTDSDLGVRYSNYKILLREIDAILTEFDSNRTTKSYHEASTMSFDTNNVQDYLNSSGTGINLQTDDTKSDIQNVKKEKSTLPVFMILAVLLVIGGIVAFIYV